jgi:hypothetical protein
MVKIINTGWTPNTKSPREMCDELRALWGVEEAKRAVSAMLEKHDDDYDAFTKELTAVYNLAIKAQTAESDMGDYLTCRKYGDQL